MSDAQAPAVRGAATGIARAQMPALVIGILGIIACGIGMVVNGDELHKAWLPAFLFWFLIAAGSLAVLMLQYVTGGEWGVLIRRPLGAAARTIPLFLIFLLPVGIALPHVYEWARPDWHTHGMKSAYLTQSAWWYRTLFYFAVWTLWAYMLRRLSVRFYEDRSPDTDGKRRKLAAAGLLMIVLTLTLCSVDWLMSLEPDWFSSMFGISFTVGAGLSAFAFVTFFLTLISGTKAMRDIVKPNHFRDLGNLMLAFTMLWAYTAFSQFLLIWYGNIKEEVPYYLTRTHHGWGILAFALVMFHFFLPFFMLLMRNIKDRPQTIAIVTIIVLIMRFVDLYWLSGPAWWPELHLSWMSLAAFAAIGGIWLFIFIWQLKGQTIIPIHETWVEEALREGALNVNA